MIRSDRLCSQSRPSLFGTQTSHPANHRLVRCKEFRLPVSRVVARAPPAAKPPPRRREFVTKSRRLIPAPKLRRRHRKGSNGDFGRGQRPTSRCNTMSQLGRSHRLAARRILPVQRLERAFPEPVGMSQTCQPLFVPPIRRQPNWVAFTFRLFGFPRWGHPRWQSVDKPCAGRQRDARGRRKAKFHLRKSNQRVETRISNGSWLRRGES